MEAKELMIGDWVKILPVKDTLKEYNTHVKQLTYDEILDSYYVEDEYNCVTLKYVEPIPLTPEILELNGFVKHTDYYVNNENYMYIILEKSLVCIAVELGTNTFCIDYVHELQHALRLCGLTELADNFKIE